MLRVYFVVKHCLMPITINIQAGYQINTKINTVSISKYTKNQTFRQQTIRLHL